MTNSSLIALLLLIALAVPAGAESYPTQASDPVVKGALVKVAEQIKLPAKQPGVLVHLAVKEGSQVSAGQVIGKIDDSEPQMQKRAANAAYQGAYKRWKDEIELEFAKAAAAVAQKDYEQIVEANKQARGAIAAVEERRAKLEWDKMELSIKKSVHDREIAMFDAATKKAEYDAAELAISHCIITAPFDGVVEELSRKQDEWVTPGDPILRLFRLDTMQVEGAVNQSEYDPHELQNCEATVEVKMARGRKETYQGRIIKVSTIVGFNGMFNVRAEVANRQEHGSWMLRDGLPATMTIHLGTGGTAAAGVSRAP